MLVEQFGHFHDHKHDQRVKQIYGGCEKNPGGGQIIKLSQISFDSPKDRFDKDHDDHVSGQEYRSFFKMNVRIEHNPQAQQFRNHYII